MRIVVSRNSAAAVFLTAVGWRKASLPRKSFRDNSVVRCLSLRNFILKVGSEPTPGLVGGTTPVDSGFGPAVILLS